MRSLPITSLCLFAIFAAAPAHGPVQAEDNSDLSRRARSILADHCLHCHGPDAERREGDLRLDVSEGLYADRGGYRVINRSQPLQSELLQRLTTDDDDLRMPPADAPTRPSEEDVSLLRRWIVEGGDWSEHWAFVPPQTPSPPPTDGNPWVRNPVDAFVLARMQQEGLTPSREADRVTLIRRATLSLTGLPPTPEDVRAFVQSTDEDAWEQVVDRLLQSPAWGEHMAFDWLDVARYADSAGYQADWERFMWPWRDWVVQAFNSNMPFDQFTIEQLAGDMLPNAGMDQQIATGFNRNHRINDEGGSLDAEFEVEYVVDRVETTATAWLGLSAGCARCHDHKYDPLSQREFYQLFAFFNNVPEKGIDGRSGAARPFIDVPNPAVQRQLDALTSELQAIDNSAAASAARSEALTKQIESLRSKLTTPVMVMQERSERKPTWLLKRGAYDHPDRSEELSPALPKVFQTLTTARPANRLEFARWLTGPDNPLTARVIVNRFWQQHFGTGLVKTSEDFGTRGAPPSHPLLLDWLAQEFVRSGWDVKALHRLIVTSATFRQTSRVTDDLRQRDPANRLLARGTRLRLSGAAIRDQALAVSGLLNPAMGGPPVKPYQPDGLWKELSFGTGKTTIDFYIQDHGDALYRRSLYTFWKRTVAPPRMAVFDGGSRSMCRVRSDRTNTPLQALTLQNDVTFVEAARHLAHRMLQAAGTSPDAGLTLGWQLAVARAPQPAELHVLRTALQRHLTTYQRDSDAAISLLSNGESPRVEDIDPAVHAAWSMVALSILNLDETITRE